MKSITINEFIKKLLEMDPTGEREILFSSDEEGNEICAFGRVRTTEYVLDETGGVVVFPESNY